MLLDGRAETAVPWLSARVLEGPEQDVPYWKVGIVVAMTTALVMYAVTLRALDHITEPMRRADVPVVEESAMPVRRNARDALSAFRPSSR